MTSLEKIREYLLVDNQEQFFNLLKKISPDFFEEEFSKSKTQYLIDIEKLMVQIDRPLDLVESLSNLKFKWNIALLNAHLKAIARIIPFTYRPLSATSKKVS